MASRGFSALIESLRRNVDRRERLFATLFLVGTFATLPIPASGRPNMWLVPLVLLWGAVGALAWASFFKPAWIALLWLVSFFLASFLFWKFHLMIPLFLLVVWVCWQGIRSKRYEKNIRPPVMMLILGLIVSVVSLSPMQGAWAQQPPAPAEPTAPPPAAAPESAPPPAAAGPSEEELPGDVQMRITPEEAKQKKAQEQNDALNQSLKPADDVKLTKDQQKRRQKAMKDFKKSREELKKSIPKASDFKPLPKDDLPPPPAGKEGVIPKYMTGYQMKDISSCALIDRIPWRFRPDQRKTRMIIKDYLRFQDQTKFYDWELYQIMDRMGYIGYVIRRPIASGRYESMIVKDTAYNRVIDDPKKGPHVVENQDLKTLINRETLVFYHSDGSSIAYLPSSIGNSVLTIQPASATGRHLSPIYLRGTICDRPADMADEDATQKTILNDRKQPTAAAPAPGATK